MTAGIKANPDGSAAIQVGGTDVITLTSGGAATFVTSPTTVQAGTAAAPSITTSGDTNTGIFFPAADTIAFAEGGAEALRINSSGTVVLSGGDTSANGIGITFPATQSASSNANTLDDYEEGNWTPTITAASGTYTTVTASGSYIKVGNAVTVRIRVDIGNNGTAATRMNIANFPFPGANTQSMSGATREDQNTGNGFVVSPNGESSITVNRYDATYGLATGAGFTLCITYITS
jgi:hypothetical protein